MHVAVDCKLYGLSLGVVEHVRILDDVVGDYSRCRFVVFASHADVKLHPVGEELHGIEHLANHIDRLGTEIGEEGYGYDAEDAEESGSTHEVLNPLANKLSVVAAGIVEAVDEQGREKLCKGDARPYHHDGEREKPFQEADGVCPHEMERHSSDEHGNEECRETETVLDEEMREVCTERSTGVGKLPVLVHNLPFARRFYHALVDVAAGEKRHERRDEEYGHGEQYNAEHKDDLLVLNEVESEYLIKRFIVVYLLFLCHFLVCYMKSCAKVTEKSQKIP